MYIILGATGHVGSAVANELLDHGEKVTVVTRDPAKTEEWTRLGAKVSVTDINDQEALKELFNTGKRLFLLNPPADVSGDSVVAEKQSLDSILKALESSRIHQVVALSTYGAQPGEGIGDLAILHELETRLKALPVTSVIVRGAYFMSNWDQAVRSAEAEGIVHSFYPVHFQLPMIAPDDLGRFAAEQLVSLGHLESGTQTILHAEGPETYSSTDVAQCLADILDEDVKAIQTPKDKWVSALKEMGFSDQSAESFKRMTEVTLRATSVRAPNPHRGPTTLNDYLQQVAVRARNTAG